MGHICEIIKNIFQAIKIFRNERWVVGVMLGCHNDACNIHICLQSLPITEITGYWTCNNIDSPPTKMVKIAFNYSSRTALDEGGLLLVAMTLIGMIILQLTLLIAIQPSRKESSKNFKCRIQDCIRH